VTDDESPQFKTYPQQDEAVFVLRMVWVEELNGMLIVKDRARFIEGNAVLSDIDLFLLITPLEP
jgi:hypothetical protein